MFDDIGQKNGRANIYNIRYMYLYSAKCLCLKLWRFSPFSSRFLFVVCVLG